MNIRRITAFIFVLLSLLFTLPRFGARALDDPEVNATSSAILYHNESGTVIYKKETNARLPAGPAVRLAAALVFDAHYKDRTDKVVTVHKKVIGLALSTLNPRLKTGEEMTVYDLLCAMLIANSDDAIYALAFDMYDDADDAPALLLAEMQNKANALGMARTSFVEITGKEAATVDEGSYTCLDDLLTLALEVQRSTLLVEICGKASYKLPDTNLTTGREMIASRNDMISTWRRKEFKYAPATGLAASNGPVGGYHVIATAAFGSKHFTCIVMGCKDQTFGAFNDAKALFEWGNQNFSYKKVLDETAILGEIKVTLSDSSDYISISPREGVSAYLPNDLDPAEEIAVQTVISLPEQAAPVYEGLIVGKAIVSYKGKELARVDLVTTGSLSQSNNRYHLALLMNFIRSKQFLFICIGAALFFILYVLISARVRYLRQNRPAALAFDDGGDVKAPPILTVRDAVSAEEREKPAEGEADDLSDRPDAEQTSGNDGAQSGEATGARVGNAETGKGRAEERTGAATPTDGRAQPAKNAPDKRKAQKDGKQRRFLGIFPLPAKKKERAPGENGGKEAGKNEDGANASEAAKHVKTPVRAGSDRRAAAREERGAKREENGAKREEQGAKREEQGVKRAKSAESAKPTEKERRADAASGAGEDARARTAKTAPPAGEEGAARTVQEVLFDNGAEDDLLVFGTVGKEPSESGGETSAPRDDYVPEGWGAHIKHD